MLRNYLMSLYNKEENELILLVQFSCVNTTSLTDQCSGECVIHSVETDTAIFYTARTMSDDVALF